MIRQVYGIIEKRNVVPKGDKEAQRGGRPQKPLVLALDLCPAAFGTFELFWGSILKGT